MSTQEPLTLTRDTRGVATLTLHRPEVRNALDPALIQALRHSLEDLAADSDLRVVVLTGAGTVFCAGADLRWLARAAEEGAEGADRGSREGGRTGQGSGEHPDDRGGGAAPAGGEEAGRSLHDLLVALDTLPRPVIARVNGPALGGGVGLVACCDVAVAADDAVLGFSEVRLGLAPSVIAPFVVRRIGVGAARRWFLTGERFGAPEALRMGLVHEAVPAGEVDGAVQALVAEVLRGAPGAQAACKDLLRHVVGPDPATAAERTVGLLHSLRDGAEGREGIAAFLERRRPEWAPPDA